MPETRPPLPRPPRNRPPTPLIEEQTAQARAAEQQAATAQSQGQTATAQAQEQTAIAFATATAQAEPIMAFASSRNGQSDIYAINGAGQLQQLTNDAATDKTPAWSPDGTKIVLESGNQIFVMNANGSNQQRLTNTGNKKNNHDPDWSPRNEIAFQTNRDGNWEIYVMNADGTEQRNLTNDPQWNDVQPAWSPDGNTIACGLSESSDTNALATRCSSASGTMR